MGKVFITTYTYENVLNILDIIRVCVIKGRFVISQNTNRAENIEFLARYNLTTAKIKDIILKIEADDFCYGLHNDNVGFEHEILFVFCPQIELAYGSKAEVVDIYSKFNIIEDKRVVMISFHQRNYPIEYLFRSKDTDKPEKSENKREEGEYE